MTLGIHAHMGVPVEVKVCRRDIEGPENRES